MLATWTKILPFFIVAWLAKRKCEVFHITEEIGSDYVYPYNGIYIRMDKTWRRGL
jgi:hypothetical protein